MKRPAIQKGPRGAHPTPGEREGTGSGAQAVRRRWRVCGQVQGVGFRPFVYRAALRLGLSGFVRNQGSEVVVEAQGNAKRLAELERLLRAEGPPLAVVRQVSGEEIAPRRGDGPFVIAASREEGSPAAEVTVDTAVCGECLIEMFDPADRRHGHALITCTHCGPRFTIIRRVPYDRPNTAMAGFDLCPACRREYEDPADRRFHAQPVACHDCGPRLELAGPRGEALGGEPIAEAARLLLAGKIVAIKGLGGYHLAVRADEEEAVARLRRLKSRDAKPFALICRGPQEAERLIRLGGPGAALLRSPAAPILLAPRREGARVAGGVAPDSHRLGVMLPNTPLQHLLFAALAPENPPLVMTSGNLTDEPLAFGDEEAVERLGRPGLCDAILRHDRPIERAVDDSLFLDLGEGEPLPLRRARGFAPAPLPLPPLAGMGREPGSWGLAGEDVPATAARRAGERQLSESPPADLASLPAGEGLCLGGELKDTVAVVRRGQAILSQHLGDLTHPLAFEAFRRAVEDLCLLFDVRPRWIAHDLHPMYLSTAYAGELARRWGVPRIGVQHHHAHAAAALAEHGEAGPALALVADGVGYGADGTIWGGELLLVDLLGFRRLARLRPLVLPGGDAAARDTRRCGLALLRLACGEGFAGHEAAARLFPDAEEREFLSRMIVGDVGCVRSSAAGRYFDGVAALLGLSTSNAFEAQAPMRLERAAFGWIEGWGGTDAPTPGPCVHGGEPGPGREPNPSPPLFRFQGEAPQEIDLAPLVEELLRGVAAGRPPGELAWLFHEQLSRAWAAAVTRQAQDTGVRTALLSGGVFCNQLLTERVTELLEGRGLRVLRHRLVPPNDGGLALGQAAVAAARQGAGKE